MPPAAIKCPSLVVPAGGRLVCSFAASYAGRQPTPGTVSALVNLAGVLIPITLSAAPVAYDFSLADSIETGVFATASNYFEMGAGILQPYGVYGEQPPPGLRLEDSREFSFVAVFGAVPSSKCGQQYKVGVAALSVLGRVTAAAAAAAAAAARSSRDGHGRASAGSGLCAVSVLASFAVSCSAFGPSPCNFWGHVDTWFTAAVCCCHRRSTLLSCSPAALMPAYSRP
jgi:hypothetical protein